MKEQIKARIQLQLDSAEKQEEQGVNSDRCIERIERLAAILRDLEVADAASRYLGGYPTYPMYNVS